MQAQQKGKCYFGINNSLLLVEKYQNIIRKTVEEIKEINTHANPNILWEIIKGKIRNEIIKYAIHAKKNGKKEKE